MNKNMRDDLLYCAGLIAFMLMALLLWHGCHDAANNPVITGFGRAGVVR